MKRELQRVREVLGPGGLLAKVVEAYDDRPQQLEMAEAVLDCFFREQILIDEAPTGVGKTMAYLVPAALYARRQHEPVIISSYTRALQDQILRQEAPRLRRLIHPDLNVVVLKGRSNYLCRRRWELFLNEEGSGPEGRWAVDRLEAWVQSTENGAFSDAPDLGARAGWVYSRIGGDARFCRSRLCRADDGCFHKRARRAARDADLVVINHSLLMADALGAGILPDHRALVVDEAHMLPDAALEPLSRRVTERSFEERVRLMGGSGEPGVSDRLRRVLRRLPSEVEARNLQGMLRDLEERSRQALAHTRAFFAGLKAWPGFPRPGERRRYASGDCEAGLLPAETDLFLSAVRDLLEMGRRAANRIDQGLPAGDALQDARDGLDAADGLLAEFGEEIETLEALLAPQETGCVYVIEDASRRGASLSSLPIDLGPPLRQHLWEPHAAVVLTSATLGAGDDFAYYTREIGLEPGEAVCARAESPFDFERQLLIMSPADAVDPRDAGYAPYLAMTIRRLAEAVERKTLVLFTSYQTLQSVRDALDPDGIPVMAQSREEPRAALIGRFREAPRAVLLGTASFWHGVDFPGRELEVLIVTRLPFPVPTDPRVAAISDALEQDGRSSFREYALPEAVLRLRQGMGRLIRRREDRGIGVILDPRITRARYGEVFRSALPTRLRAVPSTDELLARARQWFASPD